MTRAKKNRKSPTGFPVGLRCRSCISRTMRCTVLEPIWSSSAIFVTPYVGFLRHIVTMARGRGREILPQTKTLGVPFPPR
jgi:hypothetical protein